MTIEELIAVLDKHKCLVIPKSYYAEIAREHLKWDLKRDRGI